MGICLSHYAADRLLRTLNKQGHLLEPVSSVKLGDFATSAGDVRRSILERFGVDIDSMEILTGRSIRYDIARGIAVSQYRKGLPEGSLLRVEDDLYVASPAFCLVQQACRLHFVNLCQMLGWYLGLRSYKEVHDDKVVVVNEPPLITVDKLWDYLNGASGMKGASQVREALRWTCEGAASPQETNLQLALTLPARYHGFHLKLPIMNYEIELSGDERRLYDRGSCRVDLFWPGRRKGEGRGIEYQGAHHESQMEQDISRHYALMAKGIKLLYVANEQITHASHMLVVGREVAKWAGKSTNSPYWPSEEELQWLLDVLSGARRPRRDEVWNARRANVAKHGQGRLSQG